MSRSISRSARRPLVLAVALALGVGSAHAATITVTTDDDAGTNATCTLRQAVESSNFDSLEGGCVASGAFGADDTVVFDPSLANATITLGGNELRVVRYRTLTIVGSDQTIEAGGQSRLLNIGPGASLTASSLTLSGGSATDGGGAYVAGGYYNTSSGLATAGGYLKLTDATVTGNSASGAGGGIYVGERYENSLTMVTAAAGSLHLVGTTVSGNTADGPGGGIYAGEDSDTSISASSTVSGNVAAAGGGIVVYEGTLDVADSTISSNTSGTSSGRSGPGPGGGILLGYSSATITGSTISDNVSTLEGGGVAAIGGSVTIQSSTISGNSVVPVTSGVPTPFYAGGGLVAEYGSSVTVTGSTIDNNYAYVTGGGLAVKYKSSATVTGSTISGNTARIGGGIYLEAASLDIASSAITGNSAANVGGGLAVTVGDADGVKYASLSFVNSTLAANSAQTGAGFDAYAQYLPVSSLVGGGTSGPSTQAAAGNTMAFVDSTITGNQATTAGGGIYAGMDSDSTATMPITLDNTVLAGNSAPTDSDVQLYDQTGNDLISVTPRSSLLGSALAMDYPGNGNLFSDDPGLGALANNGGPTKTMLPQVASPVLDAGDNSLIPVGVTTDQRGTGFVRADGPSVDIGAAELQQAHLVVTVTGSGGSVSAGASQRLLSGDIAACAAAGGSCSAWYAAEPKAVFVPLTASFAAATAFMGWGGDCASAGSAPTASVGMAVDRACSAQFAAMTMSGSGTPAPSVYGQDVSLSATVTGNAPSGTVTFTAGAATLCSAPLAGGVAMCNAGPLAVGTHSITAAYPGDVRNGSDMASFTQNVGVAPQTISNFTANPTNPVFSPGGSFTVSATGGASGMPVTFTSATTSICTVTGTTVTMLSAGNCTLLAHQAGNANYAPAAAVQLIVPIGLAAQSITFAAPADQQMGNGPLTVDPSASSGLPVSLASLTTAVCGVSGSGPFSVSFVSAGTCTLSASQPGNGSYAAATPVNVSFAISQAAAAPSVPVPTLSRRMLLALGLLLGLIGLGWRRKRT